MKTLLLLSLLYPFISFAGENHCSDSRLRGNLEEAIKLKNKLSKSSQDKYLIVKHDAFFEKKVPETLSDIINCITPDKFDEKKAKIFFDFYISNNPNTSEEINSFLNKFFMKFKKETTASILSYPKKEASLLAKSLKFSWENANYDVVNQKISKEMPKELFDLLKTLHIN